MTMGFTVRESVLGMGMTFGAPGVVVPATGPVVSRGIWCIVGWPRPIDGVAVLLVLVSVQLGPLLSLIASGRPPGRLVLLAIAAVDVAELAVGYGGRPTALVLVGVVGGNG